MKRLISIFLILFSVALLFSEESEVWKKVEICGVEMEWDGYRVKEDGSDLDPYTTLFSDIAEGRFFLDEYTVSKEIYPINVGDVGESEVIHIKGEEEGPVIYIVAGVHGDERAAWYAGIMLENVTIEKGEVYILSPANSLGAKLQRRYFYGTQDLNRSSGKNREKHVYLA